MSRSPKSSSRAVFLGRLILAFVCSWLAPGVSAERPHPAASLKAQEAQAATITYVYDELGRLIAVVDPAGDTVRYTYDSVGNVLSISRQSSSVVSILGFTPPSGPVGTSVTVSGTGFSSTASQNTVTFNGVAATVTSATATQLGTSVPAGATTGPIAVTTPTGSATSSTAFTVTTGGAPTITGFTPTIATPATAVTITGTNFDPTLPNNKVIFNATGAQVSSATPTTLATSVPPSAGSGRISVSTPVGKAVSSEDFFVPPAPHTAADVAHTGRMAIGGANHPVTIGAANKIGLVVFDGTAGQRISLGVTGVTITSTAVTFYTPTAKAMESPTAMSTSGGALDTTLTATGTYSILIDPYSSYTGSLTLTLSEEVTGTITIGGASVPVSIPRPGQRARLTFPGTAGQRVSLGMTGVTLSSGLVSILTPDATTLATGGVAGASTALDATLPTTGTYTILVDPTVTYTGNITLTLSEEISGTITIGGASVPVSITRPGQRARLTFSGTAGQRVSAGMSGVTISSSNLSFINPDGTTLATTIGVSTSGGAVDATLPSTGTYALLLDPAIVNTGNATLTLSEEVTGTIAIGGAAVPVSITRPGQRARLTFSGTAGQRVSAGMSGVTISSSNLSFVNPDGTTLATTIGVSTSGGAVDATLPSTGTYALLLDPAIVNTGNATLTLSEEVTGTITIGGTAVPVSITRPGQRARLTFSGTAGQNLGLGMTGVSISSSNVSILKPDGTTLTTAFAVGTSGSTLDATLPVTGTYAILVDPALVHTGNMTLTLSEDLTGTLTIGGPAVPLTITRAGQNGRLTFAGTAGQQVTVRVTGNTLGCVTVKLLKPDGTTLTSSVGCGASFNLATQTLPTTGTYTVFVSPNTPSTGSLNVTVTSP